MNSVEKLKLAKDGLTLLDDLERVASTDWQALGADELQRLKWLGLFHRDPTPGRFMQRLRITHGFLTSNQARAIARCAERFGSGVLDLTTRQQIQLRDLKLGDVPALFRLQHSVGLHSMQTGMDNVRNVTGCPVAGLDAREFFDTRGIARELSDQLAGNRAFSNLPRKFNLCLTGCRENCAHAETNDLGFVPAQRRRRSGAELGFNLRAGGALGGASPRFATPLDVFVRAEEAVEIALRVLELFRDEGPRERRSHARLKVLLDAWGEERFRAELERRAGRALERAAEEEFLGEGQNAHLGVHPQKQPGFHYVGLCVPVGRMQASHLAQLADLSDRYGKGQLRLTVGQNVIVPHVAESRVPDLLAEPLLKELPADPHPALAGLVACVGDDYCSYSTIDTKGLGLWLAAQVKDRLPAGAPARIHISGCPRGCGKHHVAQFGILGGVMKCGGELKPTADLFVGGATGPQMRLGEKTAERLDWNELPDLLVRLAAGELATALVLQRV
ncbi:MAG: precorrin-3B synthase [Planctomycetes bacterium]|nr:precorrin-3B synthase [Planctomycetota bacterium]